MFHSVPFHWALLFLHHGLWVALSRPFPDPGSSFPELRCWITFSTFPFGNHSCQSSSTFFLPLHLTLSLVHASNLFSLHNTSSHWSITPIMPFCTHPLPAHPSLQMCNIALIACFCSVCLFLSVRRRVKYSLWHGERVWVLQKQWDLTPSPFVSPSLSECSPQTLPPLLPDLMGPYAESRTHPREGNSSFDSQVCIPPRNKRREAVRQELKAAVVVEFAESLRGSDARTPWHCRGSH